MAKVERILLIPDIHAGDSDPKSISLAVQIKEHYKPSYSIFLGDIFDFGCFSTFPQDTVRTIGQLDREVSEWESIRKDFRAGDKDIVVPGNHDYRLIRWGWTHPQLHRFKALSLQTLIGIPLAESGYVSLAEGNFIVTHGKLVRRWSCYSARDEMQVWGSSGASGHTHRLGTYYHRDSMGLRSWSECGHLAKNPPHYRSVNEPGPANWQAGLAVVEVEGNHFHIETIPFTLSNHAMFRGKRFSA